MRVRGWLNRGGVSADVVECQDAQGLAPIPNRKALLDLLAAP